MGLHIEGLAVCRVFTIIAGRKLKSSFLLLPPDICSRPFGVVHGMLIPLNEVAVDSNLGGYYGWVVTVMNDCPCHPTENGFDYI